MPNTPKPFRQTIKGVIYLRSVQPVSTGCAGCVVEKTPANQATFELREARTHTCVRLDCMTDTLDFIFTKESP
jgi:hypothetical protein